mgnify:CR=1 FL=1
MKAYNVKLITYPNGSAQIRKYSRPLQAKQNKHSFEMFTFQEEEILRKGGSVWKDNIEYVMNPFDKSIVPNTGLPQEDSKKESCSDSDIWHSLNRTKNKIYTYARCVKWEWFVTFTFSSEKTDRYNYDECSRLVRRWLNNQRRNAPDLQYLIVPEQHKDGAWHFHGLLANTGKMKFSDSGKKDKKGKKIYNMSKWSNGFTTATAISDVYKVSKYVGKYITKELCEMTKGKQRYFVSQNMPYPDESVFLIDDNSENFAEFLSVLVDSMGYEVIHVSEKKNDCAFVGVDYFELQDRINIK